ncbi:MAG: twin-arginine translocation signal domain-containing protein, partial [Anaerolineae bacterium]|nr:twin-arginine translocation signal domain-containing protein [Anaerolineae bacterium]
MSQLRLNRRRFIRTSLIATAGALAAACAPAPAPTAQPTEVTGAATEVPTLPAATEVRPSGKLTLALVGPESSLALDNQAIDAFKELYPDVQTETQTGSCGFDYASCKTLIAGG